jgi:hypothetical protein
MFVALGPIVAQRIGKIVPVPIEGCARDGRPEAGRGLEPLLAILVPKVDEPIGSGRGEGPVDGVEADGVNRISVASFSVALKGKIVTTKISAMQGY